MHFHRAAARLTLNSFTFVYLRVHVHLCACVGTGGHGVHVEVKGELVKSPFSPHSGHQALCQVLLSTEPSC